MRRGGGRAKKERKKRDTWKRIMRDRVEGDIRIGVRKYIHTGGQRYNDT